MTEHNNIIFNIKQRDQWTMIYKVLVFLYNEFDNVAL